ncbi:MAG: phytoene/squalene synthase family protein [Acetobacteraceae bacterium]|nr:phytoene/squalene synthase family protein [Acetobacteraceae bacterium]
MRESVGDDLAACRRLLRGGSRSFFAASLLLPRRVRRPATALYAFCRVADDLIDLDGSAEALDVLHRRLGLIYAGRPTPEPVDRALAHVVARHRIPRVLLDRLLEGFSWDSEGRRYEDLPALHAYAARVAGTVGAMMALLMDVRSPGTVARACDLGMAMQLTNIARDVGEDAQAGRVYLPLCWMREEGLDPDSWLARPVPSPALARVIARVLAEAARSYARADWGIAALPFAYRAGTGTARRLYAEIGQEVARNGYDSVRTRARVRLPRKLALAGRSLVAAPWPSPPGSAPPLECTRELVNAACASRAIAVTPGQRVRRFEERIIWLLTLFSELDQRQVRAADHSG